MNKILAIIVTYNPSIEKLKVLVSELISQNTDVIIVDNQSENSVELERLMPTYISLLDQNYGIAYAQNIGIKQAFNQGYEFVIFFDQDSTIGTNFIFYLYSDFIKVKNYDLSISSIGPRLVDCKKGFYFPALKLNKYGLMDKINIKNIKKNIEVSFLISSGTLIEIESLKEIGLMKEEYFIDFVDTEWCFRALDKGYKIYISANTIMKHSIGDDTLQLLNFKIPVHSGSRRYYRIRNLFFMWKTPYIPKILTFKLMMSNFFHQFLLFLIKSNKRDYIKYYVKAIKDGIKQSAKYRV